MCMEKDEEKETDLLILGAGDVVKNRLWPAITKGMNNGTKKAFDKAYIHTIENIPSFQEAGWPLPVVKPSFLADASQTMFQLLTKPKGSSVLGWIATPSDSHLYYIRMLLDKADYIVVEKPAVQNSSDLLELKQMLADKKIRKRLFFLSYYILEKALILTFLKRPHPFYLKYLEGDIASFYQSFLELGKVRKVSVKLIEKTDMRKLPKGGQLLETMIHHCLISSLFIGSPKTWQLKQYKEDRNGTIWHLTVTGENKETATMELVKGFDGKQYKWKKQTACIVFENGKLFANLKSKTATIVKNNGKQKVRIRVSSLYNDAYDVQYDMAYRCFTQHIDPSDIDGLFHQTEVLEWLLKLVRNQL